MIHKLYRFLPVQLFLLHLRKFQLLLIFWLILILVVTGHFAQHFGAASLFLAPEYQGHINFVSMLLLGAGMGMFTMAWHITTFIIHSKRIPFIGAARQAFLKYCINNSLLPLLFLVFYSIISIRFQWSQERASVLSVILMQLGFYLGFLFVLLVSFLYFFRVGRDLLKTVLASITYPAVIREIIPYDGLDVEFDMIQADTYLSESMQVERIDELEKYSPRLLATILRRHHRNAISATIFALVLLLALGAFMEEPALRIPAGAGFLILFSVLLSVVGAFKYLLKSWEMIGWICFALMLSWMVKHQWFDLRSIAYGMDYKSKAEQPIYDYTHIRKVFTPERYEDDKQSGLQRLRNWKARQSDTARPPLVVISVSGGGSRAAYWTLRSLQYADSISNGSLFRNCVLITGASGGMIGASYWRAIHQAHMEGKIKDAYAAQFQENIGKDLLNAIIFSFASVDLISPFNKISLAGYSYTKDRGYAMEQELLRNTGGLLDKKISDFSAAEASGSIPAMVINSTIVNDGRKLMVAAQPVSYLTQPAYALADTSTPPIDAIDFGTFFKDQDAGNLRLVTALRMNATFPYILPVVKLPSVPQANIMDAGLRDNFGAEVVSRYLFVFRDWIKANTREVIWLQIRDTREYEVFPSVEQDNLGSMMADPAFVIQGKWEPFQSYYHGYLKDFAPSFLDGRIRFITLQYIPEQKDKIAALNFHLTRQEKEDLYKTIDNPQNKAAVDTLLHLLK